MKGSSVYVTAKELEALHDVTGYLSTILEAASGDCTELIEAKAGLHSVIEKAEKSRRLASRRVTRRNTIKAALQAADNS
ncbi:hypothetical protein [Pseudomonas aeruginosa]|uniref:hypothetical protein n=1 Tax=Pseudomonas aeruginosa TaxID=287 RepID=UPI002A69EE63|nr:hypothetical protein [Pseudomonas aeruginosa]MDY1103287.1 hypothetical protein [Pseudomonas aeruginosa]